MTIKKLHRSLNEGRGNSNSACSLLYASGKGNDEYRRIYRSDSLDININTEGKHKLDIPINSGGGQTLNQTGPTLYSNYIDKVRNAFTGGNNKYNWVEFHRNNSNDNDNDNDNDKTNLNDNSDNNKNDNSKSNNDNGNQEIKEEVVDEGFTRVYYSAEELFDYSFIIPEVETETERYTFLSVLGEGSFGKVYLVHDEGKNERAMKTLSGGNEQCRNEVIICSKLRHENIIRTYEWFQCGDELFIVQEYCSNGDLFSIIPALNGMSDKILIKKYVRQILSAVDYMHARNIIHKDLKPENVMVTDDDTIKLIDFGLSGHADDIIDPLVGTLPYMAPEVYRRIKYSGCNGKAADVWAIGVIIYVMVNGDFPWDSPSKHDPGFKSFQENGFRGIQLYWTEEFHNLFQAIFDNSPKKRKEVSELFSFLDYEWFTGESWNDAQGSLFFLNDGRTFGIHNSVDYFARVINSTNNTNTNTNNNNNNNNNKHNNNNNNNNHIDDNEYDYDYYARYNDRDNGDDDDIHFVDDGGEGYNSDNSDNTNVSNESLLFDPLKIIHSDHRTKPSYSDDYDNNNNNNNNNNSNNNNNNNNNEANPNSNNNNNNGKIKKKINQNNHNHHNHNHHHYQHHQHSKNENNINNNNNYPHKYHHHNNNNNFDNCSATSLDVFFDSDFSDCSYSAYGSITDFSLLNYVNDNDNSFTDINEGKVWSDNLSSNSRCNFIYDNSNSMYSKNEGYKGGVSSNIAINCKSSVKRLHSNENESQAVHKGLTPRWSFYGESDCLQDQIRTDDQETLAIMRQENMGIHSQSFDNINIVVDDWADSVVEEKMGENNNNNIDNINNVSNNSNELVFCMSGLESLSLNNSKHKNTSQNESCFCNGDDELKSWGDYDIDENFVPGFE